MFMVVTFKNNVVVAVEIYRSRKDAEKKYDERIKVLPIKNAQAKDNVGAGVGLYSFNCSMKDIIFPAFSEELHVLKFQRIRSKGVVSEYVKTSVVVDVETIHD
jgi:hypothetical protein